MIGVWHKCKECYNNYRVDLGEFAQDPSRLLCNSCYRNSKPLRDLSINVNDSIIIKDIFGKSA